MADLEALRKELGDVYRKAEVAIKEFELSPNRADPKYPCIGEHDPSDLFIPAVNQLRYAGFHLVKADSLESNGDKENNLNKAINHCQRAYFDTKEAMLLEQLGVFEEFRSEFGSSPNLNSIYPEFAGDHLKVETIKKTITQIRKKIYVDRNDLFNEIDPHLDDLRKIASRATAWSPTLAAQDRKDARKFVVSVVGVILLALGIVATAATSIFNTYIESNAKAKQLSQPDEAEAAQEQPGQAKASREQPKTLLKSLRHPSKTS